MASGMERRGGVPNRDTATGPPRAAGAARVPARHERPHRHAVASALSALADDRIDAISAIERLRRHTHATTAALWIVDGDRVDLALSDPAITARNGSQADTDFRMALARLRGNGMVRCRLGEICGIEEFAPAGADSFIAAAALHDGAPIGVFVLGWAEPEPPCMGSDAEQIRIAAALLTRSVRAAAEQPRTESALHGSIFDSLTDRVAVIDRQGTIVAVNAAWTRFAHRHGGVALAAVEPGANYFDVCRHAAASSLDAASTIEGIEAVCRGATRFDTAYAYRPIGDDEQWCLISASPLRLAGGGAVIVHSDVTSEKLVEFARQMGNEAARRLADAVPIPIWVVTPDEQIIFGNRAWLEATGGRPGAVPRVGAWFEASHPDDRPIAAAAFRAAVARRSTFDIELRLRAADGAYRWWWFVGAPSYARDGQIEHFVGSCTDATARRHAQQALRHVASKLVAAQEAERSRIARELHDDLAQQVALLLSRLESVMHAMHKRQLSRNHIYAAQTDLRNGLHELASSIHHLSHELHPAKLKLLGLQQTLEALCRDVAADSGVTIALSASSIPDDLPEVTALCVFRVAQEALQNAVRHSGARLIDATVIGTSARLVLRISDNGHGFDPLQSPSGPSSGIGLMTMRERVELMGGTLRIDTSPGAGTTIEADVPVNPQQLTLA